MILKLRLCQSIYVHASSLFSPTTTSLLSQCSVCSEGLQDAVLINIFLWSIMSSPLKLTNASSSCALSTADKQLRSFKARTSSAINMKGVWESLANPLMSKDWQGNASWKSSLKAEERWTVWPPVWIVRARNPLQQTAQLLRGSWNGKRSEFCHRQYFCGLLSKAVPNKLLSLSMCPPHPVSLFLLLHERRLHAIQCY